MARKILRHNACLFTRYLTAAGLAVLDPGTVAAQQAPATCAVVFDGIDYQARTEAVFDGLVGDLGLAALRWHLIDDEDAPDNQPALAADLVNALRPSLIVLHYSAFYAKQQTNDNERFGDFVQRVEDSGLAPSYMVYSRTPFGTSKEAPLRALGLLDEVAEHSGIEAGKLEDRIHFVQVAACRSSKSCGAAGTTKAKQEDAKSILEAIQKLPAAATEACQR